MSNASFRSRSLRGGPARLLTVGVLATATMTGAWAQAPTSEQLVQQLECRSGQDCEAPPPPTSTKRGLQAGSGKRSFRFEPATEAGRKEVEQRVETGRLPSADLEVYFDFKSAQVNARAREMLRPLGQALNDPRLAGFRFVLVGHTDAKGGDALNQRLSEQRAAAVKDHLVRHFGISADRLDTFGRGKSVPKNATDGTAAENRRVQVINQGAIARR